MQKELIKPIFFIECDKNNNMPTVLDNEKIIQYPYFEPEIFVPVIYEDVKPNHYLISNYGNVYSIKRNIILKQHARDNTGHLGLTLRTINEIGRAVQIHRLVATAFIPKTVNDIELGRDFVNHKDGIGWNNYYKNLEWCTNLENIQHAHRTGLTKPFGGKYKGEDAHSARLNNEQVHIICKILEQGGSYDDCCNTIGLEINYNNRKLIGRIKTRKAWIEISSLYNIPEYEGIERTDYSNYIIPLCELLQYNYYNRIEMGTKKLCLTIGLEWCEKNRSFVKSVKSRRYYINISKNYTF